MFYLYGIQVEYVLDVYDYECRATSIKDLIATFDKREAAQEYIKKSKLKKPNKKIVPDYNGWYAFVDVNFRSDSLLSGYNDAEIEEHRDEDIPHNPSYPD